jgi:putative DNA primase/helicase
MTEQMHSLRIIQALKGNERSGMCPCPAHDDHNPSLHVSTGKDGKVLVKCHARCSQEAVITALKARALWPTSPKQAAYENRQREWERKKAAELKERERLARAHSILRMARSDDLTQVRRYLEGRGINSVPPCVLALTAKQSRELFDKPYPAMVVPIGNPKTGIQGVQVTHLSRVGETKLNTETPRKTYGKLAGGYVVVRKLRPDQPLIVGEGVESVLSACQITGLPGIAALSATNLPNITPPPCREIIIAADNDEAGRNAAKEAARKWARTDCVLRIAVPGDEGNDWNDVVREARDEAEIEWWRDAILNIEPEEVAEAPEVEALGMEQFMHLQFPPRQFLLRPWLTTTGLTMIDAPPGHGKTWLALSVGYAVASGKPIMDWAVEARARVLYVDGELPGGLFQKRLETLGPPLPDSDFRLLSRAQFDLRGVPMIDLGSQEGRDYLDQFIERHRITLIILDSVSTLVRSGVDNDVESWRAIQDWSLKHRAHGRAVIYLHHHGRSGNPRGTSAREIVLDARIKLTRDDSLSNEEEKRTAFKLEFPKAREFFGPDAAPRIAYLSTRSGVVRWKYETMKASNRERINELSRGGMPAADIARELGLTRGRVSQIMAELRTPEPSDVTH